MKRFTKNFALLSLLILSPSLMAMTDSDIQSYTDTTVAISLKEIEKDTNLYEFEIVNNSDSFIMKDSIFLKEEYATHSDEYSQSLKIRYPLLKPKETYVTRNRFSRHIDLPEGTYISSRTEAYLPRNNIVSIAEPFNVSETISQSKATGYNCIVIDCNIKFFQEFPFEGSNLSYEISCAVSLTYENEEYCFYGLVNIPENKVELHLLNDADIDPKKVVVNSIDAFTIGHPIEYDNSRPSDFKNPNWLLITIISISSIGVILFIGLLLRKKLIKK